MKSIILTDNHKSKLLEMCKKLFPEYNIDNELYGGGDYVHFTRGKEIPNIEYDEFEIDECIHWFEFCVTKLAPKILCQNKSIINSSYSKNYFLQNKIINSNEHIVNYLYEEFKKLK